MISGIVRDGVPPSPVLRLNYDINQKLRVEFRIFSLGSTQTITAAAMVEMIAEMIPDRGWLNYIPQIAIDNTPLAVQAEAEAVKSSGKSDEGIVLRNPDSVYAPGRWLTPRLAPTNNLLKVKNFVRSSFVIIGFGKGRGKYRKSLGNLWVRGMFGNSIITAKVGTGFSDAERSDIWENQSTFLGRDVEAIYLGVTPNGSLRHPIFSQYL